MDIAKISARVRRFVVGYAEAAAMDLLGAVGPGIGFVAKTVFEAFRKAPSAEQQAVLDETARVLPADVERMVREALASLESRPGLRPLTSGEADTIARTAAMLPFTVGQAIRVTGDGGNSRTRISQLPRTPEEMARFLPLRPSALAPGRKLSGGLVLERLLGQGGFGEVWRARNVHLGETVAVKFCTDPAVQASLRRETALMATLRRAGGHPNVLRIDGADLDNDPPFVVLEYADGGDLAGWAAQFDGPAPPDKVVEMLRQVAAGLAFAHGLGIVHRDLKPGNILVGADGGFRIADLGIGALLEHERMVPAELTWQTMAFAASTIGYTDPARLLEVPAPVDDIYALAIIGVRLLRGDLRAQLPHHWPEDLEEAGVPASLTALLRSCLGRIERRPADGAAFLAILDAERRQRLEAEDTARQQRERAEDRQRQREAAAAKRAEEALKQFELRAAQDATRQAQERAEAEEKQRRQEARQRGEAGQSKVADTPPPAPAEPMKLGAPLEPPPPAPRPSPVSGSPTPAAPRKRSLWGLFGSSQPEVHTPLASGDAGSFKPLSVFRDRLKGGGEGPEMVVIPAGRFLMGAPAGEEGSYDPERPQHEVTFARPFALARDAVTFEDYDRFCESTQRVKPEDGGWGRGRRPAMHVSWHHAVVYCAWLTEQTGAEYRLPSESEWEYACRAGTTTPFAFGETISTDRANHDGNHTYGGGRTGVYRKRTVPVDELDAANGWGLRHMHGNVWEWCADPWHDNYEGAPGDGSVWTSLQGGDGTRRALRGGSWYDDPGNLRSANRYRYWPSFRLWFFGFRPARTLFTP